MSCTAAPPPPQPSWVVHLRRRRREVRRPPARTTLRPRGEHEGEGRGPSVTRRRELRTPAQTMRREAWPPARMTRVRVRPQGEDEADEEGRGRRGRGRSVRAGKGGASVGTRRERSELATKALDPARGLETTRPVQRVSRPATGSGSTSLARRLARRRRFSLSSFNQRWRGVSCKNDTKKTSLTHALYMPFSFYGL